MAAGAARPGAYQVTPTAATSAAVRAGTSRTPARSERAAVTAS
ncbi:hypothetical protein ABZ814_24180 [Micromonospora musae]